ncbi:ParB/RepB/Spo0J family partition protein [Palleronia sp.]|uniref:ParB/RepB/Spo0J family partition protein n=1 Tax=Palleronia sp. TaxID=1940284 RepID=UPI0035C7E68A
MAKKRRMFDIEMPEGDAPVSDPSSEEKTFPAGKVEQERRRGPMAAAIRETAESARERQEAETRIRAENDALAHEHMRLKRLGLVVDLIPLDRIDTTKLVRDRQPGEDPELDELKESIRSLGLSNPIRVEEAANGRFELVQGYRRLSAYHALLGETGEPERWGRIPAAIWGAGESLDSLYRRMVDENLVRKDVSFAEMAQLALDYAGDPNVTETDPDRAVAELFKSAGYQKRSYIRSFIRLVDRLGPVLKHKREIPRSLGVALVARMDSVENLAPAIAAELKDWDGRSAADELGVLRRFSGQGDHAAAAKPKAARSAAGKAKTSFQIERPEGRARCTAAAGRLEVKLDRDFSTVDRRKLEQAVRKLLDTLD